MHSNKKEGKHNPLEKGKCGAMVDLLVGCFTNLLPNFSAFGNNALNTAQPSFLNKGNRCDNEYPRLIIWKYSLCSTYDHSAKDRFLISESKHVTIINIMLPYSLSYKEYLVKDIRLTIPNIHISVNIPLIDFCFHVKRSTYIIGSYIVVNPSGQN
jgi:hypothetical protein